MDGRVGGGLQMDAMWTQGRWGSKNLGIFADVIYLRSLITFLPGLKNYFEVDYTVFGTVNK